MSTMHSPLEKHATELGLTQEDASTIERVKPPVATADKVLLGLGCCLLAAGAAALGIWMIVPTLMVSGVAAALLVRHLNSVNALPDRPWGEADLQLGGAAVQEMLDEEEERRAQWNRNTGFNPVFRSSPSNIYHDHYHHR